MIRKAAFSGRFYPGTAPLLKKEMETLMPKVEDNKVLAGVVPHAGYMYSGEVAARFYAYARIPSTVVILGPNHTGYGKSIACMSTGVWQTPLGAAEIYTRLATKILQRTPHVEEDHLAHLSEHSIEVQLPFLQHRVERLLFVPIAFMQASLSVIKEVGEALAEAVLEHTKDALIIATTDLSHYERGDVAKKKDERAMEAILRMDEEELLKRVREEDISMCGTIPTAVLLCAAKKMGAKKAHLLLYRTSGDVTGDHSQVVGYCSIAIV
jgi:hypothetical protein